MGQAYDNQQEAAATMAAAELLMEQALDKEERLDAYIADAARAYEEQIRAQQQLIDQATQEIEDLNARLDHSALLIL